MINSDTIGIDLGGTIIRAGRVRGREIASVRSEKIIRDGKIEEIITQLFAVTEALLDEPVEAIGIGVPGLVNEERGIVFDALNIPSWKEVPLKQVMEERFQEPVLI